MTKYPNLPGVEQYVYDGGFAIQVNNSLPVALVFGTTSSDNFSDGTPIRFNEPYAIPDSGAATAMFTGGSLGAALGDVFKGSNQSVTPVAVRIGYKSTWWGTSGNDAAYDAGVAKDADTGADVSDTPTASVDEITEGAGYTDNFNGTVKIVVIEPNAAGDSLDGLKVGVTFDGTNYEAGLESVAISDASPTLEIASIGLKVTFTVGTAAPSAGDYWEFEVHYADEPADNDELYKALQDAYIALEGYEADYAFAPDAKADATVTNVATAVKTGDPDDGLTANDLNFAYQLARFCYNNSTLSRQCLGFIGVKTPVNFGRSYIKTWINSITIPDLYKTDDDTITGTPLTDPEGAYIDMGKNLCVVLGHGTLQGRTGIVDLTNYVGGVIAKVPLSQGIVKIALPHASLAYRVSLEEANTIAGKRITPIFVESVVGGTPRILTGRTAANAASSFTKIGTVKIVNYTLNRFRSIADRYLGKRNSAINRESMRAQMQSVIMAGVEAGLYQSGSVAVNVGSARSLGVINVRLSLKAYAEINDVMIYATFEQVA